METNEKEVTTAKKTIITEETAKELDNLLDDTEELIDLGLEYVDDVNSQGLLNNNQSEALDNVEESFNELSEIIADAHNETSSETDKLVQDLFKVVQIKKAEIAKAEKPNWETN